MTTWSWDVFVHYRSRQDLLQGPGWVGRTRAEAVGNRDEAKGESETSVFGDRCRECPNTTWQRRFLFTTHGSFSMICILMRVSVFLSDPVVSEKAFSLSFCEIKIPSQKSLHAVVVPSAPVSAAMPQDPPRVRAAPRDAVQAHGLASLPLLGHRYAAEQRVGLMKCKSV